MKWSVQSVDTAIGTAAGVLAGIAGHSVHGLLAHATNVVYAEIALAAAILAVVLTALSVLVAFLGDEFVAFLRTSGIGVEGAMRPYKVTAVISSLGVVVGLGTAIAWSVADPWTRDVLFATSTGLTVWAVVGTAQLIFLTAWFGQLRARIGPEVRAAARQALRDRQSA